MKTSVVVPSKALDSLVQCGGRTSRVGAQVGVMERTRLFPLTFGSDSC